MVRKLSLVVVTFVLSVFYGFSQNGTGEIIGYVYDGVNKTEGIYDAKVILKSGANTVSIAKTDLMGKYRISNVQPGTYDVEISQKMDGYESVKIEGINVSSNGTAFPEPVYLEKPKVEIVKPGEKPKPVVKGPDGEVELGVARVIKHKIPLIDKGGNASGGTVGRQDIAALPGRSIGEVTSTVAGTNSSTGEMSIRGAGGDATYTYIDNVKISGSVNLPKSALEEVQVMTGGIPANYGDITGGVISVTTRGPSSNYFGSAEIVSSGLYFKGKDANGYDGKVFGLDKYGYNLAEGMLSGPLLFKKDSLGNKTKPLLGFLISANFTDQLDSRPLANGGQYRVKKEVRDAILANPLREMPDGRVPLHASNFLHASDFEQNAWRMNARTSAFTSNAKIDVKTGPTINLTFGGTFNYNFGKDASRSGSLLNFTNNGDYTATDYRVYGRFTQTFENSKNPNALIKSASYTLMVDYSNTSSNSYDGRYKYNAFEYGHVGTFTTTMEPSYAFNPYNFTKIQTGNVSQRVDFVPSTSNSTLAAITSQYYSIYANNPERYINIDQLRNSNAALVNGGSPDGVYGLWTNIGTPYNTMSKGQLEQFRVTGNGSINIGGHRISLGFEFEQRFQRSWGASPSNLWFLARKLTNAHISELDYSKADTVNMGTYKQVNYQNLNAGYAYKHNGVFGGDLAQKKFSDGDPTMQESQSFFDYNLRNKLHLPGGGTNSTWVDVDRLDPSLLSVDMFSADELLNNGSSYISYSGYDKAGNKTYGKTDINDYFTKFDEHGNYKRAIGAFQPIYVAGYIMDKFSIDNLLFNVGLRIDAFDANQPVLKDPYLLYNAHTVSEAKSIFSKDPTNYKWLVNDNKESVIPSSMGDNYVVYVNDANNPTLINGYRSGSTWYNAQGIPVDNPKSIEGSGGIQPWLVNPKSKSINASAFETYKPQINFMPRFSFSFPISDEALFFAHYDILTKRPTSGNFFDPTQYQFIGVQSSPSINNANLKPETTIDYELGFQQKLTNNSSIKISSYYREQRNMVQVMNMVDAYPKTYSTMGNRDFGTVKGLTIAYDLRRTGNIRLTANYTLQFADGTGTDGNLIGSLLQNNQSNLRNIFPYSYDTRHQFNIVTDYRYGSGERYNGPQIGTIKLFENTGINFVTNIFSGNPYSSQQSVTNIASGLPSGIKGTPYGSRKPWSYRLDIQIDRNFQIKLSEKSKTGSEKEKLVFLNVYIRTTNLFNQFNVLNVFRATGNWNDDGFLSAVSSKETIQAKYDSQAFIDYYSMMVQNSYNISSPRTIRLGLRFDF